MTSIRNVKHHNGKCTFSVNQYKLDGETYELNTCENVWYKLNRNDHVGLIWMKIR
jgi:hypothetical protein